MVDKLDKALGIVAVISVVVVIACWIAVPLIIGLQIFSILFGG